MSGQGPTTLDTSTIAAIAALVVAFVAMLIALLQVLQQYISSGTQVRLGDRLVFGLMPGGVYRKWSWTQFRFRVLYRIPDVRLQPHYPEGHRLYGSKHPLLPSLWCKREKNEISVDAFGTVSFTTLTSNSLLQWWSGNVSFRDAITKIVPAAVYSAVVSTLQASIRRQQKIRSPISSVQEKDPGNAEEDLTRQGNGLESDLKKRALSAYGDFGGPSEASWLSFWRRYQLGSDASLFFEMREGDADRCPTDVQVVPMKVILQDVVTAGCLLGMRVIRADQSKRTLQMEGSAGMLISSPHASLGTIVRFIPGHASVRRDLYSAKNPTFPYCLERIWGQVSVAGRPLNHGDTQRIADINFNSELNTHNSLVFVGKRKKRESRVQQDRLYDRHRSSKSESRRKSEHGRKRFNPTEAEPQSTSVDRRAPQLTHQANFDGHSTQLERRKPRRRRESGYLGAAEVDDDHSLERKHLSHGKEDSECGQYEECNRKLYRLPWHRRLNASGSNSSLPATDTLTRTSGTVKSGFGALVSTQPGSFFEDAVLSDRSSIDTWSIRVESVDSLEYQHLGERSAEQPDTGAGWTPLPDEEITETQGDECLLDSRTSISDAPISMSTPMSHSSQEITDSENMSSFNIAEWSNILADLRETEVFLKKELNEKIKRLKNDKSEASAKDHPEIDLTDLRQEIREVRAEWQKSRQKIQRWESRRPSGDVPRHSTSIKQGKVQKHSDTEGTTHSASRDITQDALSPLNPSKTGHRRSGGFARSRAQYSAIDSDSGDSYLRQPLHRRNAPRVNKHPLAKTLSRPARQPQDHRDCPGSAYWLCQSDVLPGFWITPYADCVNTRLCVNGAFIFLEALKRKSDDSLLQWHYSDNGPLKEAKNMIADGVSTWPLYAHNARGGSTRSQSGWRVDSRLFKSQQVMPIVLPQYNRESIRKPGGLHKKHNDEDLCELMVIDLWLNHAGDLDEIASGKADLCRLTPALVREVVERFEVKIISLTFNQSAGNFQDVLDLAEQICQHLYAGLRLSEAEEIYLLLALYRAMKVGICISAGIDTASVIWVAFTGGSVFMV